MRRLSANFTDSGYASSLRQWRPAFKASLMKTNIRRRICISAAYLERIRSQKRKSHPEGQRRAPSPTIQSMYQSYDHTRLTPKTDPDHTDSGGLKPTAINPDYWDLVPHSDSTQQHETRDGGSAIRRHKQPSGRALRRASAAGKSSWQRALDRVLSDFCPAARKPAGQGRPWVLRICAATLAGQWEGARRLTNRQSHFWYS